MPRQPSTALDAVIARLSGTPVPRPRPAHVRLSCQQLEPREVPAVRLLADVSPILPDGNQTAGDVSPPVLNNVAYFVSNSGETGKELFRWDGTRSQVWADLSPGGASTDIAKVVVANGYVVFAADSAGDGVTGHRLYVSDGVSGGASLLTNDYTFPGSNPGETVSEVVGLTATATGVLWGGFTQNPNGTLRETAYHTTVGGTNHGHTRALERFDMPLAEATNFVELAGRRVFTGNSPAGRGLYGATNAGSAILLAPDDNLHGFQNLVGIAGDRAVALLPKDAGQSDYDLWVTDGTSAGTQVIPIPGAPGVKLLGGLVEAGGRAYFTARGPDGSDQLWVTQGDPTNTVLLKSGLNPEANDAPLKLPRTDGTLLYFPASDGIHGSEMWVSDGTEPGTKMLADVAPGSDSSVDLYAGTAAPIVPQPGGIAYFLANIGGTTHPEFLLHRTDGTAAGTFPVERGPTVANLAAVSEFYVGHRSGHVLFRGGSDQFPKLWAADPASGALATTTGLLLRVRLVGTNVEASLHATVDAVEGPPQGVVSFRFPDGSEKVVRLVNGLTGPVDPGADFLRAYLAGENPAVSATFVPDRPHQFRTSSETIVQLDLDPVQLASLVTVPAPAVSPNPVKAFDPLTLQVAPVVRLPGAASRVRVQFQLQVVNSGTNFYRNPVPLVNGVATLTEPAPAILGEYEVRAVVLLDLPAGRTIEIGRSAAPLRVGLSSSAASVETSTTIRAIVEEIGFLGAAVLIEANVGSPNGTPVGVVRFSLGSGNTEEVRLVNGSARVRRSLSIAELQAFGANTGGLGADYAPDPGTPYRASSVSGGHVVFPPNTLVIAPIGEPLSVAPGERVTMHFNVTFNVGVLPVPIPSGIQVRFELVGPGRTERLGVTPIRNGHATLETTINLSPGEYTVRAVVVAGEKVTLGEPAIRKLTVRPGELGSATRLGPRLYAASGTNLAAAAVGTPATMTGTDAFASHFGMEFESALSALGVAPSQVRSMALRYLAPMTGGDNVPDEVWVGNAGGPGVVAIRDGATGKLARAILPYAVAFIDGVFVTGGDLNGDGQIELVFTPDVGGSGHTVVYDAAGGRRLADFFGIDDPNFRGGARAAVTLFNGVLALVVAAGHGGGPRIAVFDAKSVLEGADFRKLVGDFFAFEPALRNGAYVTGGDVNGDGTADLIAGAGPGGGPRVFVLDGAALMSGELKPLANFFAGDVNYRNGIKVKAMNLDGDNLADIITADPVTGATSIYLGRELTPDGTPTRHELDEFLGGVPVG